MNYFSSVFTGNYLHFTELFQLFPNIYFYKIKIESKLRTKHPRLAQEDDVLLTEFLKIYDPSFRDFLFKGKLCSLLRTKNCTRNEIRIGSVHNTRILEYRKFF